MKRYSSYKDSGVEWIGEIPSHWEVKKLKYISDISPSNVDKHIFPNEIEVKLCNYTDVYYNDFISSTTELKSGSCNQSEYEKFSLKKGDVIITKDSESPEDIGVPCYIIENLKEVVCGYHLTLIRPTKSIGGFVFRFVQSDRTRRYFEVNSNGITRYGLGKSSIENLIISLPPHPEQLQIVRFLDTKTELIDTLIEKTQRKIELLKEKRTSLINHTVTKGLNPDVEMKDSGVEWIGEIPRHWDKLPLKYISYMKGRIGWKGLKQEEFLDCGDYILVTGHDIKNDKIDWSNCYYISKERYEESPEIMLEVGDLLFTKDGTIGKTLYVEYLPKPSSLNSHLLLIRPLNKRYISKYLQYLFKSSIFLLYIEETKTGTTFYGVSQYTMENFKGFFPPLPEQQQIVSYLDEQTQLIDKTVSIEERRIELLKENRQSLISEVVTGKIKVTTDE